MVKIIPYQSAYEAQVEMLKHNICQEFFLPPAPVDYRAVLPQAYWIALHQDEVVGSVGINLVDSSAILKRMFVKREFRGETNGISVTLLNTAVNWSKEKNKSKIFLGTMAQFKRAHKFYEKHGFVKIAKDQLPSDFENNPLDSIYYERHI